jgi:hypothetical protein
MGEAMVGEAMDFTECPELSVRSGAIHGRLSQDTGLTVNDKFSNLGENIVFIHLGFQGKRHLLPAILPPKLSHRVQMGRFKGIGVKQHDKKQ